MFILHALVLSFFFKKKKKLTLDQGILQCPLLQGKCHCPLLEVHISRIRNPKLLHTCCGPVVCCSISRLCVSHNAPRMCGGMLSLKWKTFTFGSLVTITIQERMYVCGSVLVATCLLQHLKQWIVSLASRESFASLLLLLINEWQEMNKIVTNIVLDRRFFYRIGGLVGSRWTWTDKRGFAGRFRCSIQSVEPSSRA